MRPFPAVAAALLAHLAFAPAARAGEAPLFSAVHVPLPGTATSVGAADLDGDGHLDIVCTDLSWPPDDKQARIFPGNGAGLFGAPEVLSLPSYARDAVISDLDGDALPDLAILTGTIGRASVSVYRNSPAGLGDPAITAVDPGPAFLAEGDFDGDGALDLVCTANHLGHVNLLQNDGQAGFTPAATLSNVIGGMQIAVTDFNVDGNLDFAVANISISTLASVFVGNGAFGFSKSQILGTTTDHLALAAGDWNTDGWPDLAVGEGYPEYSVKVFRNLPGGPGLLGLLLAATLADAGKTSALRALDLDADGQVDLAQLGHSALRVYRGDGTFGFDSVSVHGNVSHNHALGFADFDTDGRLDALLGGYLSTCVLPGEPG